jgi:hypothetical protein
MNEQEPKEPELRVLSDDESPARGKSQDAAPRNKPEHVEVLQPVTDSRPSARSFEPDVDDILAQEEECVDSEALWGAGEKKAPPVGWFVLVGIAVFGLAIWAALNVFDAQPDLKDAVEEKKEILIDRIQETKDVRLTLDLMKECARGYLMATSVEEKLPYVRHADRVKPMMEGYYRDHEMKSEDFRNFEQVRSMGLESLSFVFGQVELNDGNKHKLLLEQLEDGSFRVDWESDVCYLPVAWDEYLEKGPPESVVMRVFIKRDHFYAYEFRDEDRFDSYQLTTRDSEGHLFGFVEKGSKVGLDIRRFLKKVEEEGGEGLDPLMLRLRFPKDSHSRKCVWIDALITPRWTYVKSPGAEESGDE